MLAFAAGIAFARTSYLLTPLAILSAVAAVTAIACAIKLQRRLMDAEARYGAVFERAGISMWRENWSAAAHEVAALLELGITDLEAYFATRPDELRALCAKVTIDDVNLFTVEEAGAPGKHAFIGPLVGLLPSTDQTFVQWLVAFAEGAPFFRSEAHVTLPDGSIRDTLFAAALPRNREGFANVIVTSLDITGYKSEQTKLHAADAALARAARISAVGALSASIAHEVNTPLAAILANAQAAIRWLRRPVPNLPEADEAISAIVSEATRAKDVVARTRAFVGNTPFSAVPFDVVAAAREATLMVEQELRRLGATVHLQADSELPAIKGDVIQVQQVFTNLLLNAAQAMAKQKTSKDITLSLLRDEGGVRIDISDTGPGIDQQQLKQIFDPFYSTKPQGMGMGLAICRNCIDAHGGNIWATSAADAGTTIHFTLPARDD